MESGFKPDELRNLSVAELDEKLAVLKKQLLEYRFQVGTGRLDKPDKIKQTRRNIARIMTIKREKENVHRDKG